MPFGFAEVISLVGVGAQVAGAAASFAGNRKQAEAFRDQAQIDEQTAAELAEFELEITDLEVDLLEEEIQAGIDQDLFNAEVALENAEWEAAVGAQARAVTERRWENQISAFETQYAAGNIELSGVAIDVIADQTFQMMTDLDTLEINTANAVSRATSQAELFKKHAGDLERLGEKRVTAVQRAGEIRSETARKTGAITAGASRIRAEAADVASATSILGGVSAIAEGFRPDRTGQSTFSRLFA